MNRITELFANPVIAAVKNEEQLDRALVSTCDVIFLLFGDILNIAELTQRVSDAGKHPFVHIDLISGLAPKEIAVDYIKRTTTADGIISTKLALIRRAHALGLFTVLRIFAIDSMALDNLEKEVDICEPDIVEILPSVMPDIIQRITNERPIPIIAGGLISSKKDILSVLSAGAIAVSTTHEPSWEA